MCVCHSDEVMRDADADDTSVELWSAFKGVFWVNLYLGAQSWKY